MGSHPATPARRTSCTRAWTCCHARDPLATSKTLEAAHGQRWLPDEVLTRPSPASRPRGRACAAAGQVGRAGSRGRISRSLLADSFTARGRPVTPLIPGVPVGRVFGEDLNGVVVPAFSGRSGRRRHADRRSRPGAAPHRPVLTSVRAWPGGSAPAGGGSPTPALARAAPPASSPWSCSARPTTRLRDLRAAGVIDTSPPDGRRRRWARAARPGERAWTRPSGRAEPRPQTRRNRAEALASEWSASPAGGSGCGSSRIRRAA
jgi:hypothetical protein